MNTKKKVLYFDCFAGASGDMIVGALLDLGVDLEALKQELTKLFLKGYQINTRKITKAGFSATKFDVMDEVGLSFDNIVHNHVHKPKCEGHVTFNEQAEDDHFKDNHHEHGHNNHEDYNHEDHHHKLNHDHAHHHSVDMVHNHDIQHSSSQEYSVHRNLGDIVKIIENSDLAPQIKDKSIAVFQKLAYAEAKIHGTEPEKIHFHEVGAVDAIVDIVGAVIALHFLDIDKIVVSPLPMGQGFVHCQHGVIPVPAPATLELLIGMKTYGSKHNGETVTPTGAAILSTLADECGSMPSLDIVKVGYGAGTRDFGVPNLLRAVIGWESQETPSRTDLELTSPTHIRMENIICLEANIDDMNAEFYDYIFDMLLAQGAMDVFLVPIQMKKNRPAQMLRVLCQERDLLKIAKTIFQETSTIGVRFQVWQRFCLERAIEIVQTTYGEIRIKKAYWDGEVVNLAPEYDDCKKRAVTLGVPLKEVYWATIEAARA